MKVTATVIVLTASLLCCEGFQCSDCESYCKCVNKNTKQKIAAKELKQFKALVKCEIIAFEEEKVIQVEECMIDAGYFEWMEDEVPCSACSISTHMKAFNKKIGYPSESQRRSKRRNRRSLDDLEEKQWECLSQVFKDSTEIEEVYEQFESHNPEYIMERCYENHCGEDTALEQCLSEASLGRDVWDAIMEYDYDEK